MKRLLLLVLLAAAAFSGQAQRVYFIYLQSDNGTPFYVKLAGKVHSSTGSGYLILSDLQDSSYTFRIGFATQTGEAGFGVDVKGTDHGYLVKMLDGKLALVDILTLDIHKATSMRMPDAAPVYDDTRADAFTRMLANASGDPSLLGPLVTDATAKGSSMEQIAKPQVDSQPLTPAVTVATQAVGIIPGILKDSIAATAQGSDSVTVATSVPQPVKDSSVVVVMSAPPTDTLAVQGPSVKDSTAVLPATAAATQNIAASDTAASVTVIVPEEKYERSEVTRRSESSTTEGFGLVYLDRYREATDTIRILIPNPRFVMEPARDTVITEKAFKEYVATAPVTPVVVETPVTPACTTASEKEFLQLRKQMAADETAVAMVETATVAFRERCYTTEQLRYLAALFLTDAGKLAFFKAAKDHCADPSAFPGLGAELKDPEIVKQFGALSAK